MLATAAAKLTIAKAYQASVALRLTDLAVVTFELIFFGGKGRVSTALGSSGGAETFISAADWACGRLITGSPKLSR